MIRIIVGEETTMAHFPSGKVEFLSFWAFVRLAWWAIKNKQQVVIESLNEKKRDHANMVQ